MILIIAPIIKKDIFVIPLLNHPITWYGFLFVIGFVLSYFVVMPMMTQFLVGSNSISSLDIFNWPKLVQRLREAHSPVAKLIAQRLKHLDLQNPSEKTLQEAIIREINTLLATEKLERSDLEQAFPHSIRALKETSQLLIDRLCWFVVLGTLIGARLGDVFFYDWSYYQNHLWEIPQIWKGGLASHGGVLGILTALYAYFLNVRKWIPSLTFLTLLDLLAIPSALVAGFIRIGNFINQEILGTATSLLWGIIFGDPIDGSAPIPRHPVQLYESIAYFGTFFILYAIWYRNRNREKVKSGLLIGWMLILIFTSRFVLEFFKTNQASPLSIDFLQAGQLLSLPFILWGICILLSNRSRSVCCHKANLPKRSI